MAATVSSILLILTVAFTTTAIAHHSPSSNETLLIKKCTEALGEVGAPLVTFCAHGLLGHEADFLARCDRRETMDVVIKEAHNRAKAVVDLGEKINSDKSLNRIELQDLKKCWRLTNNIASSLESIYTNFANAAMKESSMDMVLKGASERRKEAKNVCNFSHPRRQSGVWLELKVKARESSQAEVVALAFANHLYAITH